VSVEADVIERDAPAGQVPEEGQPGDKGKGKGKEPETVTLSKSEVESLRRERDEARESERYWSDRARGAAEPEEPKEPADPDDDDPDPAQETLVDDFSSTGIAALVKRGLVTKKDAKALIEKISERVATKVARQVVGQAQAKATADTTIMSEFGDLKDENSELFKQTKLELARLGKLHPGQAHTAKDLYSAASIAQTKIDAKKPKDQGRNGNDGERYDYQDTEGEEIRRLRVDSQGGARGRTARQDIDDDILPPQTKQVLAGMFPDKTPEEREKIFRRGQGRSK